MLSGLGRRVRRWSVVAVVTVAMVTAGGVAVGSHTFSDVFNTDFFHDAVEWVSNRGITAGVAPGLYGPNQVVTRGQMAVFLQRLGEALTPTFMNQTASIPATNFAAPVDGLCKTASHMVGTSPQTARVFVRASIATTAITSWGLRGRWSTNDGATWSSATPGFYVEGWAFTGGFHGHNTYVGTVELEPGEIYVFGAWMTRRQGLGNITEGWCHVHVEILNRNGTSSPLAPEVADPFDEQLLLDGS